MISEETRIALELDPNIRSYPCGCINQIDPEWGILHSMAKCEKHHAEGGKTGLQHYIDMGCIVNGVPQHAKYECEMQDALEEINSEVRRLSGNPSALEIGSGLSMYAPLFLSRGFRYEAIERDSEAENWASSTFGVAVHNIEFERFDPSYLEYSIILAAHVFEHLDDAPAMMKKAFDMLVPGGRLILIVPNGEDDPVNPDHVWFFTPATLRSTLDRIGFTDVRMVEKRIVPKERFIYASATK